MALTMANEIFLRRENKTDIYYNMCTSHALAKGGLALYQTSKLGPFADDKINVNKNRNYIWDR